jgi:hypothetical protein
MESVAVTGSNDSIELTVLMPCLNEAETLATCIRKALRSLQDLGVVGEVLIADNGSTDGSQEIAVREGARLENVPTRGYGAALIAGIAAARGSFIIMGDADDSYAFDDLGEFVEELRAGADLVMGNRFKGGIQEGAMPFLHKYLGNPVLSFLGRALFRIPVKDFHCGLRGFRRSSILDLGLRTPGMEFASEMVVKAALSDLVIVEVPTTLAPDGRSRSPHLRTWRDGWRHLRFLFICSPTWIFAVPGCTAIVVGLLSVIALARGPVAVGDVRFDIQAMLFMSFLVLCGFQLVAFGIAGRSLARALGVLPPGNESRFLSTHFSLERGLALSVGVLVLGVLVSLIPILGWLGSGLGAVDLVESLRTAIPGLLLLALGFQGIFVSFFLGIAMFDPSTRG